VQNVAPLALEHPTNGEYLTGRIGRKQDPAFLQPAPEGLRGDREAVANFLSKLLGGGIGGVRIKVEVPVVGKPAHSVAFGLPVLTATATPSPRPFVDLRFASVGPRQVSPPGGHGTAQQFKEAPSRLRFALVVSLGRNSTAYRYPGPLPERCRLLV
jgi:hypothetical protein